MKFYIFIIFLLILNFFTIVKTWGYDKVVLPNQLEDNKNTTRNFFEKGLHPHIMKVGFRLKNSEHNEVDIFSLTSKSNKLSLRYYKNENKTILHLNMDIDEKTRVWEVQYPNINLKVGDFHYFVYRFGKLFFKLWIDCQLKRSTNSDLKTLMHMENDVFKAFGNDISLMHGDNNDIEYNQQIKFINQPNLDYSFDDRGTCDHVFKLPYPQIRINDNNTQGWFYPLDQFQDVLTKFDSPGVYYELSKSTIRDVSEYFEDGLDKDHSFEMTYRIKEFPISNYSYYLILLRSGAESQLSLSLNGKRNILAVHSGINSNNKLIHYSTEYWADEIYNNDWHTIKYSIVNGTFTLWIDNEMMEDFLGFKQIDLKYNGYDRQYVWYDTALMILEPKSGLHKEPVLHIRHMKYFGNAITTNNTELSIAPDEKEQTGYFESFFKTISRTFSSI